MIGKRWIFGGRELRGETRYECKDKPKEKATQQNAAGSQVNCIAKPTHSFLKFRG